MLVTESVLDTLEVYFGAAELHRTQANGVAIAGAVSFTATSSVLFSSPPLDLLSDTTPRDHSVILANVTLLGTNAPAIRIGDRTVNVDLTLVNCALRAAPGQHIVERVSGLPSALRLRGNAIEVAGPVFPVFVAGIEGLSDPDGSCSEFPGCFEAIDNLVMPDLRLANPTITLPDSALRDAANQAALLLGAVPSRVFVDFEGSCRVGDGAVDIGATEGR